MLVRVGRAASRTVIRAPTCGSELLFNPCDTSRSSASRHFAFAQPTTRDGSRPICGRYFTALVVIMTPSHAFGALGGSLAVTGVALVIAVREPRCEFSQITLPDWPTAQRTERLRAGCPAIDQDEFHMSSPRFVSYAHLAHCLFIGPRLVFRHSHERLGRSRSTA